MPIIDSRGRKHRTELEWVQLYSKMAKLRIYLSQKPLHWKHRHLTRGELNQLYKESKHTICDLLTGALRGKNIPDNPPYLRPNYRYCSVCDLQFFDESFYCPCCNYRTRTNKHAVAKAEWSRKAREKKEID